MRVLGALIFIVAAVGLAYSVMAIDRHRRPRDVLFSVLAPVAAILAMVGLVLAFVPDFFG